ncbi:hypothetical protein ACJJTC_001462 [Scirpophaga incertulas]
MAKSDTKEVYLSDDEIKLQIAINRRDNIFARLQTIFNYSKNIRDEELLITLRKYWSISHAHPHPINNFESFMDKFVSSVNALKNINIDNLLDFMFLHIALKKVDPETARLFEFSSRDVKIPTFCSLVEFIRDQLRILQNVTSLSKPTTSNATVKKPHSFHNEKPHKIPQSHSYIAVSNSCRCLCDKIVHDHLYKCPEFSKMTPSNRFKSIKDRDGCVNCLSLKHKTASCHSNMKCKVCNKNHHTLLHIESRDSNGSAQVSNPAHFDPHMPATTTNAPSRSALDVTASHSATLCSTSTATTVRSINESPRDHSVTVLLATAGVYVYDLDNNSKYVRCMLDSGSQSHFITFACVNSLGLRINKLHTNAKVKGIGGIEKPIRGLVNLQFSSRFNVNVKYNISLLVVDNITDYLPTTTVDIAALPYLQGLPLADESFGKPGKIDMLIGADLFSHLLLPGIINSNCSAPPAIRTVLGYVVMGTVPALPVAYNNNNLSLAHCCIVEGQTPKSLDNLLKDFWEVEELPMVERAQWSLENIECDHFFRATTTRSAESGRYMVALPFRKDVFLLGDSTEIARKRYLCLERKLESVPNLRTAYNEVIHDYLQKGYLSPLPPSYDLDKYQPHYIIPHHAVVRLDKSTTKLRIVLDASCKTSSGVSLNDLLHSGPNLQGDLFDIILNFRLFAVALSADCKQMFLQIEVQESDRRFQRRDLKRSSPKTALTGILFRPHLHTLVVVGNLWSRLSNLTFLGLLVKQILSYEELITVVAQIACLLNSRPLTVLSADPSEPTALTPAHFLHTVPLSSLPAPEIGSTPEHLLERQSLMDKIVQSFWKRWRKEYLHSLQTRQKWNRDNNVELREGTVVIIMNDNFPPLSWPLGVIEKLHPSKDGLVRVVSVRTTKGIFTRPVIRLCPLPRSIKTRYIQSTYLLLALTPYIGGAWEKIKNETWILLTRPCVLSN